MLCENWKLRWVSTLQLKWEHIATQNSSKFELEWMFSVVDKLLKNPKVIWTFTENIVVRLPKLFGKYDIAV